MKQVHAAREALSQQLLSRRKWEHPLQLPIDYVAGLTTRSVGEESSVNGRCATNSQCAMSLLAWSGDGRSLKGHCAMIHIVRCPF